METASGAGGWHVRDCSILGQRMCSEGSGNSGRVSHARGGMVTESGRTNRLQGRGGRHSERMRLTTTPGRQPWGGTITNMLGGPGIPELQTARNRFGSDLTGSRMPNGPVWVCSKFGELWRLCQDCVCCQVGFGFKGEKSERPCNLGNTDGLVLTSDSYREMNGMLDGLAPKK